MSIRGQHGHGSSALLKKLRDHDHVYEAKASMCRFQLTDKFIEDHVEQSGFISNAECIIEQLCEWCGQDSCRTRSVLSVLKGLENERNSEKAIGFMKIGITVEETNALQLDEYMEELFDVFDFVSGTRLDPELLKVSRQVEIDFMSRLGVCRKRPRTWATDRGIPVIPTKWATVNKGDARQPESRSRLCGKELERWDPTMPGTFVSMGPLECVMFLVSKALIWNFGVSGPSARKIMFLDASRAHCQADATSEMAIELPAEEQVKGEDLVGELLKSLYETTKAAHKWEKKWQSVLIKMNFEIGTWSPAIVCCRERDVCGFVHGDDFIFIGESRQLAGRNLGSARS